MYRRVASCLPWPLRQPLHPGQVCITADSDVNFCRFRLFSEAVKELYPVTTKTIQKTQTLEDRIRKRPQGGPLKSKFSSWPFSIFLLFTTGRELFEQN